MLAVCLVDSRAQLPIVLFCIDPPAPNSAPTRVHPAEESDVAAIECNLFYELECNEKFLPVLTLLRNAPVQTVRLLILDSPARAHFKSVCPSPVPIDLLQTCPGNVVPRSMLFDALLVLDLVAGMLG